jgi:hypothetical protein
MTRSLPVLDMAPETAARAPDRQRAEVPVAPEHLAEFATDDLAQPIRREESTRVFGDD